MQFACDQLLTRAVFTENEYVGIGRACAPHEIEYVLQRGRLTDDVVVVNGRIAHEGLVGLSQCPRLDTALPQFERSRNGRDDLLVLPRLGDEVRRTFFHRFDCRVKTAMCSNHNDDRVRIAVENALQPVQSLLARRLAGPEVHIEEDDIDVVARHLFRNAFRVPARDDRAELAAEQQAPGRQNVLVVVDDKNIALCTHGAPSQVSEIVH